MLPLLHATGPHPRSYFSIVSAAFATAPVSRPARKTSLCVKATAQPLDETSRRSLLGAGLAVAAGATLPLSLPRPALAGQVVSSEWEQVRKFSNFSPYAH